MRYINVILCFSVIAIFLCLIWLIFFRKRTKTQYETEENRFDFEYLAEAVAEDISNDLKMHPEDLNLNKYETQKLKNKQADLRKSIDVCISGDTGAKNFMIDYIAALLQSKHGITEETIDLPIPFEDEDRINQDWKFEILLRYYERTYKDQAIGKLIEENHFDQLRNERYYVDEEDINALFHRLFPKLELSFTDKMDILAHGIYQKKYGHGCVDKIRDMNVEGISLGVSGIPASMYNYAEYDLETMIDEHRKEITFSYDSTWIMYQGKEIHFRCIGCHSERELIRVCKNLYRYGASGHLSAVKGRINNDMKDGSRISAARPPFCESWFAIVRKHSGGILLSMEEQIQGEGAEKAITLLKSLVWGERTVVVTGGQRCGKSTLLRNMILECRKHYTIRVEESIFELLLRKLDMFANILSFKESDVISGQDVLNFTKKVNADVLVLGEVASPGVAAWLIQATQTGGPFTLSSNHAETVRKLLMWYRNALLKEAGFSNERIALEQVVDSLQFDVHMKRAADGFRYPERITEIIPDYEGKDGYLVNDILRFDTESRSYRIVNRISPDMERAIMDNLYPDEKAAFEALFDGVDYKPIRKEEAA